MYEKHFPHKRFKITLEFIQKHFNNSKLILDLGTPNPFTEILKSHQFNIINTSGIDLDLNVSELHTLTYDKVIALEIFEHLLNPFTVLKNLETNHLIASVPLKLWFSKAYRSKTDPWDRHYHEFEDWQFQWLLEKTGWKIIDELKFTHPTKKIGIRPLLRLFTPRYYLVYATRT